MQSAIRWILFGVLAVLLVSGCGRTALDSQCDVDDDCELGLSCVDSICVDAEPEPNQSEQECFDDLDCGDGTCRDGGDQCVGDVCNTSTGFCEVSSCTPNCGEDEREVGCYCIPYSCETDSECDPQVCTNGMCSPCVSDAQCSDDGTRVCVGGLCQAGADCSSDDDCRPHERCADDQTCVQRPDCTFDDDCGEDEQCIAGSCTYTPDCTDDTDCSDQAECVGGQCQLAMCRGSQDCDDDELCDGGDCVTPPVALSCEVVTSSQTIVPNEQKSLNAFAYDEQGNGVAASFVWSSSDENVASIDGDSVVGGAVVGSATVTATLAGGDPVACSGAPVFDNLGLTADGDLRVRVVHMETGAPIEGAEVYVEGNSGLTDASGLIELPEPDGEYDVSVFHGAYNYLTVQGASASDIRLPISPMSGTGPVAGFTGQFDTSAIQSSGEIGLGLAGASLAGDLLDVNLERLLGDPFYTELGIPGMGDAEDVPIPGGVTFEADLMGLQLDGKDTYYVQAADGPRLAWGIAGEVPFTDLLGVFSDPPDDIGSAIGTFLPLFSRFDHAQHPKVLNALPRVQDIDDINNNGITNEWIPDYNNFPEQDLMPSVRQQLTTSVNISSLPTIDGEQASVAVLVGATQADELGLVPLGISAVHDDSGQPDSQTLYMAPPYGSAVGGRYVVMAISFVAGGGAGDELATDFSVALWNSQYMGTDISLGTFPDSSSGSIDETTRTVKIDDASAGPIFRTRLVDTHRSWDIWSKGADGVAGAYSHDVSVPTPPDDWNDLFDDGEQVLVDAIRSSVSIDDLVRSSGVGLHRAGLVTTSFNRTVF